MGFHSALDDGETQAGAFDFSLRVVFLDTVKTPEDMREVGTWDAYSVVQDPDAVEVVHILAAYFHLEPRVGVLFE